MKQFTAKCYFCKNTQNCDAHDSIPPNENTPSKNIFIDMGEYDFSLLCDNPSCRKYTISCTRRGELERLSAKYKTKTL